MKKFFSLVLALVMALSLTTVAWGVTGPITDNLTLTATDADPANIALDGGNANYKPSAENLPTWINCNSTGKNITIDLGGQTFTMPTGTNHMAVYIGGTGTVTIKNGTIVGNGYTRSVVTVGTGATVNLENVTITAVRDGSGYGYGSGVALYQNADAAASVVYLKAGTVISATDTYSAIETYGTLNIENGATVTLSGSNTVGAPGGIGSAVGASGGTGVINISGGAVTSTASNGSAVSTNSSGGSINITGGELTGDKAVHAYTYGGASAEVKISGGELSGEVVEEGAASEITVSGGIFDTNVSAYLATGYETAEVGSTGGTFVVGQDIEVDNGKITAGTFTDDVSAYVAAGNDLLYTNGSYMAVPKTAAAGTTTTLKDADKYDIYGITGTTSVKATKADIIKKVTSNVSVTVDGKTTTTYTATTYSDGVNVYVEVDASVATHKLLQGNNIVAYMVNLADVGNVPTTTKVATAFVEAKKVADQKCGDYTVNGYVVDGKTYIAGGANWAVLNGKFVQYTETLVPTVAHDYAAGSYNVKDKSVATVKCVDCKATWTVLTEKQVKTMAPSAYTKLTTGTAEVIGLYIPVTAAPAAGTTGTLVESAQTFDAGIAMYVGMSVMAAAGSVVVFKKRED